VGQSGVIVFFGQYRHSLDPKGRLSIPGEFREALLNGSQELLMVTTNFDQCLVAYCQEEWNRILDKAKGLPMTDRHVEDFMRYFIASARKCPLDRHGRILIPPTLRGASKLNKEVILLGMNYKFEVWDHRRWKEKEEQILQSSEEIKMALASLGL